MTPTQSQVSAGGVVFRRRDAGTEIALICVAPQERWQLPKGLVEAGEPPEATALREVREETGLESELIGKIDTVEYWYVGHARGRRTRFHKHVHFYLLRHLGGRVQEHDREVLEARWVGIEEAHAVLAFKSEREIVERARAMIAELERAG